MNLSLQARLTLSVFTIPLILGSNECVWGSNSDPNEAAQQIRTLRLNPIVQNNNNLIQPNEPVMTAQMADEVLTTLGLESARSAIPSGLERQKFERTATELKEMITGCSVAKTNKLRDTFMTADLPPRIAIIRLFALMKIFKHKPDDAITKCMQWLPEFLDMKLKSEKNNYILTFMQLVDMLNEKQLITLRDRANLLEVTKAVQKGNPYSARFLGKLIQIDNKTFDRILNWNRAARVFSRCAGHGENMENLFDNILPCNDATLNYLTVIFSYLPENYLEGSETTEFREVVQQNPSGATVKTKLPLFHTEMLDIISWLKDNRVTDMPEVLKLLGQLNELGFKITKTDGRTPKLYLTELLKHFRTCQQSIPSIRRLNSCLSWIKDFNLLQKHYHKCFSDILNFVKILHINANVMQATDDIQMDGCLRWMQKSGTLAKCLNLTQVAQIMSLNKLSTDHRLDSIEDHLKQLGMWEDSDDFQGRYRRLRFFTQSSPKNPMNDVTDCFSMLFDDKLTSQFVSASIARYYIDDMVNIGGMVKHLNNMKRSYRTNLLNWLHNSGGYDLCLSLKDLTDLIQLYQEAPEELLTRFVKLISQGGFVKEKDGNNLNIDALKGLMKPCILLRSEGKICADFVEKVLSKFESPVTIRDLSNSLNKICSLSKEDRVNLITCLESSGVLDMCRSLSHLDDLVEIYQEGKTFNLLPRAIDWLKQRQLPYIDHTSISKIRSITRPMFKEYVDEQSSHFVAKIFAKFVPGEANSSQNLNDISLVVFNIISPPDMPTPLAKRTAEDRARLINWLEASGLFEMCDTPGHLLEFIKIYNKGLPVESLKRSLEWLKKVQVNVLNDHTTSILLSMLLPDGDKQCNDRFKRTLRQIVDSNCMGQSFVNTCLINLRHYNPVLVSSVMEQRNEITSQNEHWYLLAHVFCAGNPSVVRYYEDLFENAADNTARRQILTNIVCIIGENTVFAQNFGHLMVDYENPNSVNSCLPIHRKMMEMSKQLVIHPENPHTEGCKLNVDLVKEPRPTQAIHMPLNVWKDFFKMAKAMDQDRLRELCGETPVEQLWAVENLSSLTSLLDPIDSLRAAPNVSGHSMMLRSVLRNIQQSQNIEAFIQLLVNVLTCITGKMNGIAHTYGHLIQNCVLDESKLNHEAFKSNLLGLIKEGLLRYRETCISHVARAITQDRNDPAHNYYFVRAVIGRELGLFLENERPAIDINITHIDRSLLLKSKQELLNLFYRYYNVENVIKLVHTMLHDGSIQLNNQAGQTLAARVVAMYMDNEFLGEDGEGFNPELVVMNGERIAGLTPKAVVVLLKQMGILLPSQSDNNPCAQG